MIPGARIWMMAEAAAALVGTAWPQSAYASNRYLYIEQLSDMAQNTWEPDTGCTIFKYKGCRVVALADDDQRVSVIFVYLDTPKTAKKEEKELVKKTADKLAELLDLPTKPKVTLSQEAASAMLTYDILFNQAKEKNSGLLDASRLAALHYMLNTCNGALRGWHGSGVSFWATLNRDSVSMRFEATLDLAHNPVEYAELRLSAEQNAKFERSGKLVKEIITGYPGSGSAINSRDLARELNATRILMAEESENLYITWKSKVFRAGSEETLKSANKRGRSVRDYIFSDFLYPDKEAQLPSAPLSTTRKVKRIEGSEEEPPRSSALGDTEEEFNRSHGEEKEKDEPFPFDINAPRQDKKTKEEPASQPAENASPHTAQPLTPQEALDAYINRLHKLSSP